MSDRISRADAIEVAQTYLDILINSRRHGDDFTFINVLTDIRNKISSLPSADAVSDAYKRGFEDAKRAYEIELARSADAVQGWIPLSHDGLGTNFPYDRDGEWVIVTDGNNISVERIKKDAYDHFFPNGRWFGLEDVIAWMPLPKPYKGEETA